MEILSFAIQSNTARSEQCWNDVLHGISVVPQSGQLILKAFQEIASKWWQKVALQPRLEHCGMFREMSWAPGIWWYVTFFRLFRPHPSGIYLLDIQVSSFTSLHSTASTLGRKGANKDHMLQPKCWTQRQFGALHSPRSSLYISTPAETTLLQAQVSLGTIGTRLEGTSHQSAHAMCRISCPFHLNSLRKIISAKQRTQPPVLCVPGKCLAFSECHQIRRLTINHRNLDPSVLRQPPSYPCSDSQHLQHTIPGTARLSSKEGTCSLAHTRDFFLCVNEPHKAITCRSSAAGK